jgi:hypothetical protein
MRKLIDGREVEELEETIALAVKTKAPQKWLLIDQETGQIYQGCPDIKPRGLNVARCHEWKILNMYVDTPEFVAQVLDLAQKTPRKA